MSHSWREGEGEHARAGVVQLCLDVLPQRRADAIHQQILCQAAHTTAQLKHSSSGKVPTSDVGWPPAAMGEGEPAHMYLPFHPSTRA